MITICDGAVLFTVAIKYYYYYYYYVHETL